MATTVDSFYDWLSKISNPANVLRVKPQPAKKAENPGKKWLVESVFDDLPIEKEDEPSFVRLSIADLNNLEEASKTISSALRKDGFFVLSLDAERTDLIQEVFGHSAKFFTQPQLEKEKMKEISVFGRDSGYSRIYFDNTDSKREPEQRDVIEIRYVDALKLNWPNDEFKQSALELYQHLFGYSTKILEAISLALECDDDEFWYLLGNRGETKEDLTPQDASETNFCMFRYQDDDQRYSNMQKCMVHRDSGLITLLPHSTSPGIHVLDKKSQQWYSMEHFTKPNDVLVFCGDTMEYITSGYFRAAIHRVVREPGLERYSMPFEVKPHLETFMKKLNTDVINKFLQTDKSERVVINPQEPTFHAAICNECSTYLVGNRWKCKDCEDYDLCDTCMKEQQQTHPGHSFELLTKRIPLYAHSNYDNKIRTAEFVEEEMMHRRLRKRWRLLQVQPPFMLDA